MQLLTEAWMWLAGNDLFLLCIGLPALVTCLVIVASTRE
jgi:hypothetical protein